MSIPCNNRVVCRCENSATLKSIKKWFTKNCRDFIDIESNNDSIWFDIDHDYGFPARMMQQMTTEVGNDETLQISVLTYDQSQEYIAHHTFENGQWKLCYESCRHPLCEVIG